MCSIRLRLERAHDSQAGSTILVVRNVRLRGSARPESWPSNSPLGYRGDLGSALTRLNDLLRLAACELEGDKKIIPSGDSRATQYRRSCRTYAGCSELELGICLCERSTQTAITGFARCSGWVGTANPLDYAVVLCARERRQVIYISGYGSVAGPWIGQASGNCCLWSNMNGM